MLLFTTDRLTIRTLAYSDINAFHDMLSNPNVMQYIKPTLNFEESKVELKRFIDYYEREDLFYHIWAVTLKDNPELIGLCGIYANEVAEFEIAYRFREHYWRNGFGKEIAKRLISYSFDTLGLPVIHAYAHVDNKGSIAILESIMTFEKEFLSPKTNYKERKYILKQEK